MALNDLVVALNDLVVALNDLVVAGKGSMQPVLYIQYWLQWEWLKSAPVP